MAEPTSTQARGSGAVERVPNGLGRVLERGRCPFCEQPITGGRKDRIFCDDHHRTRYYVRVVAPMEALGLVPRDWRVAA
jgi:hypothetical protein